MLVFSRWKFSSWQKPMVTPHLNGATKWQSIASDPIRQHPKPHESRFSLMWTCELLLLCYLLLGLLSRLHTGRNVSRIWRAYHVMYMSAISGAFESIWNMSWGSNYLSCEARALVLAGVVPSTTMKIMRLNFGFAWFLWCHAYAILMPFNWFPSFHCSKEIAKFWSPTSVAQDKGRHIRGPQIQS